MKKAKYFWWILTAECVGILAGLLSQQGMEIYGEMIRKPVLSPPAFLFPVVWTILYALMGIGAARVDAEKPGPKRSVALNIYVIQLVVNFFWSLIFFRAQAYGFAFLWLMILWVLIIVMIVFFRRVDKTAALLQIPYFLWVTFAAYLNFQVWRLNP